MRHIGIKRVYEKPSDQDGTRVLVDRLWPRGLSKEKSKIDLWLKDVAPSADLRIWFGHDPGRWVEFQKRYREELANNKAQVSVLRREAAKGPMTLLYGAKDQEHNHAIVLHSVLTSK